MRSKLAPLVERARVLTGELATATGSGSQGAFELPGPRGMTLYVLAGDGRDWREAGLPEPRWEHVSVSLRTRCPSWDEMEWVKREFWEPDEWAMQLHAPPSEHVNEHPHTLHLWRPVGVVIPLPPKACV